MTESLRHSPPPLSPEWKDLPSEKEEKDTIESSSSGAQGNGAIDGFFEADSGSYYRPDSHRRYIKATVGSMGRYLRSLGYSTKIPDGQCLSPKDSALEFIERDQNVAYAGALAGKPAGLHKIHGEKILVTGSPRLIEPEDGNWELLKTIFSGLLGDVQTRWFYAWVKVAIEALRAQGQRPGQALVIAGPVKCGKSLCQAIITELLGGRSAHPYAALTGRTDFNSELFAAEHLVIEDEAASADPRVRKQFGHEIKKIAVNWSHRCHRKNREALTMYPFWRLSITLNDDIGSLQVLPQLEDGVRGKLMLFRAKEFEMPVDTSTQAGQDLLWNGLIKELPAFVHFLLNEFEIEEGMKDSRCGVRHFHNLEILEMIDGTSDEWKLLELIDRSNIWEIGETTWEGPASEVEGVIRDEYQVMGGRLFGWNSACGQLLALLKAKTDRVSSRVLTGQTLWKLTKPSSADK